MLMKSFIAERKLLYSLKGSDLRNELIVRVSMPFQVDAAIFGKSGAEPCFGCHIELVGVDETISDVYGADSLQAINIASDVESILKRLENKYNLYWASGDPYFE
jgi:hypothetical protein